MQNSSSPPKNAFTGQPLTNWPEKYRLFFTSGALSFAKQYDCGLSFLITALALEYGESSADDSNLQNALDAYMNGASAGDCLCCLKVSEIFSWKNNPFKMKVDSEKAWVYMIMAMFYSLCTPFGFEVGIRPIFMDFVFAMNDDFSLKKTIETLKNTNDPFAKRHKQVMTSTLLYFFDQNITPEVRLEKFRDSLFTLSDSIDEQIIGSFLINIFSGDYQEDAGLYETDLVHGYFNTQIIQLFALYNVTFTVDNELHAGMLTGFSANLWHFLIWKGKTYDGEIDDCLKELVRMCKFICNNIETICVPLPAYQLFIAILAWCYRKGFFIKKDLSKAHAYLNRINDEAMPANLLFDKAKVKDKLGLHSEAKHLFQKTYQTYMDAKNAIGESKLMPFDFYVLGYLEMKLNKNAKRAKEYFEKGYCQNNLPNFKAFECLAFQRKCLRKIEKLDEDSR